MLIFMLSNVAHRSPFHLTLTEENKLSNLAEKPVNDLVTTFTDWIWMGNLNQNVFSQDDVRAQGNEKP